eukprot:1039193-Prymnesium_polylepis.1
MVQAQTHQTCPDVPQTARRPDGQTPARRLPDVCQTPTRRGQTQPDVPDARAQIEIVARPQGASRVRPP